MTRQRPTPPLSTRELRQRTQPRRGLGLSESAIYCGLHPRVFSRLVKAGRAPPPKEVTEGRSTIRIWDLADLDTFIDRLPIRGGPAPTALPKSRLFNM